MDITLKKWLESENAIDYDFVEETAGDADGYKNIKSVYERYFLYKADDETKEHIVFLCEESGRKLENFIDRSKKMSLKDPDGNSVLLQKIYQKLWPPFAEQPFMKNDDGRISSDTMTSVQTSLNETMKIFKAENDFTRIYKAGKIYYSENCAISLAANEDTTHFCEKLKGMYPELENFIARYHTIGNYCPVPEGFNSARSNVGKHDYWDLSLMKIHEWYLSFEDEKIDEASRDNLIQNDLLHRRGSALNCIRWLSSFGKGRVGWHNFVDTLYMQDYVYNEEDKVFADSPLYYVPKPFWEGHSWEKITLPNDKCNEFFGEVSLRIFRRGKRMIKALKSLKNAN